MVNLLVRVRRFTAKGFGRRDLLMVFQVFAGTEILGLG